MRRLIVPAALFLACLGLALPGSGSVSAQGIGSGLGLPGVGPVLDNVLDPLDGTLGNLQREAEASARDLLRVRERDLARFLRRNEQFVEADLQGNPARRGELLAMDIDPAALGRLEEAGFRVIGREEIEGLDIVIIRLAVPDGAKLAAAQEQLRSLAPQAEIAPDSIHFQSGNGASLALSQSASSAVSAPITTKVGIIDGGVAAHLGSIPERGFAQGAPLASNHGTAIAHLLMRNGVTNLRLADVYGSDPAGGNALAIARALGWLVDNGSKIVTISLVGPRNGVVERAIGAAQRKGTVIVAAVGNDGPAAPNAFPASYDGVVAVTGIDGRKRALIEAGRASHLDYAAPGADIFALNARGRRSRLRGTSFATPLVAARIAAAMQASVNWRAQVDREAQDLGARGHDDVFGRGLLCGKCSSS